MFTPRLSLSANRNATVPLRFDDEAFADALRADASVEDKAFELTGKGPLARLLGVAKATDYDLTDAIADGWTIHARQSITGAEEDELVNVGQRKGGGTDIVAHNKEWWATWVRAVTMDNADDADPATRRVLDALSSRNDKARGEAYSSLPVPTRDAFTARLRAHVDVQGRPADRDPGKAPDSTDSWSPEIQSN